jgi:hypothetical protein
MVRQSSILSFLSVALISILVGCETERIVFPGPYFVRFTDTELTLKESFAKPISIEVHNAGPAPKSDVVIGYTIGGSAREGIDYTILGTRGKVKIESGDYFGNIQVQLINNSNNILRSQELVLTLLTADNNELQVGQGVSAIGNQFTLTILDDCILGGNYYGLRTLADVPIEDITITSTDCKNYLLSNWDIYIFSFSDTRDLVFIDNDDNTITIPPQEESTLPTEQATIDGSGVVDPTTRIITLTVRLVDFDDQPTVTFKLYPD